MKALLAFTIFVTSHTLMASELIFRANPDNQTQTKRGEFIYQRFCALCHGKKLEGQTNWRIRKADGKLPAPPHDETGHTWHHDDQLLFNIIKYGLVPPYGPKNYASDMPAWGETLKDEDIWAVLAYIKSRWPEETRKIQEEINQDALQNAK